MIMEQKKETVAGRVLARITNEHLVPRPRWEFIWKNYFFWTLGALAVAIGALAFSAMLFEIENIDWRLSVATHTSLWSFFLDAAPILWVSVLALFILVGYGNIRRTKHGYRYPLAVIALGAVLTSFTLGGAFYAAGFGGEIEEAIGDHPPFYRPILLEERSWWLAPQKGLLAGQILSFVPGTTSFVLRDLNGRIWNIEGDELHSADRAIAAQGGIVRVVGTPTTATNSVFHACFVFPWRTYNAFFSLEGFPVSSSTFMLVSSSSSERNGAVARNDSCKGIRPYEKLRAIDEAGL